MTEYVATYRNKYWADGWVVRSAFITGSSWEVLHQRAAEIHYEEKYGDFATEGEVTYDWRVYKLAATFNVESLPEYQEMLRKREEILAAEAEEEKRAKALRLRVAQEEERKIYERLKEKFEGQEK